MHFCRRLWNKRAQNRHNQEAWSKKYIASLEELLRWTQKKRLTVEFIPGSSKAWLMEDQRTITLPRVTHPKKQLCYLLHECGHVLIGSQDGPVKFARGYPSTNKRQWKTRGHHIDILREEIHAWELGWKLCQRLKLKMPWSYYEKTRDACLLNYAAQVVYNFDKRIKNMHKKLHS